jgi:hypothetical protein
LSGWLIREFLPATLRVRGTIQVKNGIAATLAKHTIRD